MQVPEEEIGPVRICARCAEIGMMYQILRNRWRREPMFAVEALNWNED